MDFQFARLRLAERIIGAAAIAFLVILFLFHWYGISSNVNSFAGLSVNVSRNGWDTFTNSRWVWLASIVVALAAVYLRGAQTQIESAVGPGVAVSGLGALSTILILYRIIHHPTASASIGSVHVSLGIKIGIWLGLIASAALTYGGYVLMGEEGESLPSPGSEPREPQA